MNGLDFALQMELDGEKFYRELALKHKDNNLHPVFISLAEEEKMHAKIIKDRQLGSYSPTDVADLVNIKNIFTDATGLDVEKDINKQINAYRKALDMEKKSIDLYKKLLSESNKEKNIFEFLIKEEEKHYKLIEEIVTMVNRPNEWVESAEFGEREKY